jgi:hypothetical protein
MNKGYNKIIVLGAGIGILAVERIDRNVLPRGYEHIDNGKIIV